MSDIGLLDYNVGWAENRLFIHYMPPPERPNRPNDELLWNTSQEMWIDRMKLFVEDLKFLLKLHHHRFWSQMVYHSGAHAALESFLLYAPRMFDPIDGLFTEEMFALLRNASRYVFLIYLRLSTHKESKMHHITPSVFADLIYDNYLFDIPKILDLCVRYGHSNKAILQKMISNIFTIQPKYHDDLEKAIVDLSQIMSTIISKCGLETVEVSEHHARRLSESKSTMELSWAALTDMIYYFIDESATIFNFLDVYPAVCSAFHSQYVHIRIATFYSVFVPFLIEELICRSTVPEILVEIGQIRGAISYGRTCLLNSFRKIVECSCIQPLLENGSTSPDDQYVEDYFQILACILPEKKFLIDYEKKFPFDDDVEVFIQLGIQLEQNRLTYIKDSIQLSMDESGETPVKTSEACKTSASEMHDPSVKKQELVSLSNVDTPTSGSLDEACVGPKVSGVKLDSLISQVKDLLPDLGDGFIEECLNYYNYQPEQVINGILEASLPNRLKELDHGLTRNLSNAQNHVDVLSDRKNVFDKDEFDVFNRDKVDMSKIHKGKWSTVHGNSVNPEDANKLKNVTLSLSTQYDNEDPDGRKEQGLYDDEYDDTYDEQAIGVNESVTWDELLERRPFVTPVVLRGSSMDKDEAEVPSSDSENDNSKSIKSQQEATSERKNEFVPNPEIERQRAARRSGANFRDVKGRPKGQGQDTSIQRNRSNKEKNKASRGNHNRRAMSDKKRAGGMFQT